MKKKEIKTVFMDGEVTGHSHHTFDEVEFKDETVKSKNGFTVTHEEHKPLTLPEGEMKVGQVVEYDPYANEIRRVAD